MNCLFCGEESESEVCESCKRAGFSFTDNPCEKKNCSRNEKKRSKKIFDFKKIDIKKLKS